MCFSKICLARKGTVFYGKVYNEDLLIPCGKCIRCKERRIDDWVIRLKAEDKNAQSSYFITFTYDTQYVPISKNGFMTLNKEDMTRFFKRLRKTGEKIKYLYVGEYGSANKRPHYHALIFDIKNIENVYKSWKFGYIHVGQVSGDSIAYTMKYMDKPAQVGKFKRDDRLQEFMLSSKSLGASWITQNKIDYYNNNLDKNYVTDNEFKKALPRFYSKKMFSKSVNKKRVDIIQQNVNKKKELDVFVYEENNDDTYENAYRNYQIQLNIKSKNNVKRQQRNNI